MIECHEEEGGGGRGDACTYAIGLMNLFALCVNGQARVVSTLFLEY